MHQKQSYHNPPPPLPRNRCTGPMLRAAAGAVTIIALLVFTTGNSQAQADRLDGSDVADGQLHVNLCNTPPVPVTIIGEIQSIVLDDPADVYSGGSMVVSGQTITLPRNLLIDLPANRLTLQQLFVDAPPECVALGESGLSRADVCVAGGQGGIANMLANRTRNFETIVGEMTIQKGSGPIDTATGAPFSLSVDGMVTYIDYTDGYFRVNGIPGDPATGVMVRINDPEGVHTVQQGLGCDPLNPNNCSPDARFGVDPENYTISFLTGYPACLPSTVTGVGNRVVGSDVAGVGDPFCPDTNRPHDPFTIPVADSRLFAPIQLGDTVFAEGNSVVVGGAEFYSVHTVSVGTPLLTLDDPTQPDYVNFGEADQDAAGFERGLSKLIFAGEASLLSAQLDVFALHVDPATNQNMEVPVGSTVGNPLNTCMGVGGGGLGPFTCTLAQGGGLWRVRYDINFTVGVTKASRAPCATLFNAGLLPSSFCSLAEEFAVTTPISRELLARSRHKAHLLPGIVTLDVRGNEAPNGQYLTPNGISHPATEIVEQDVSATGLPVLFAGNPWLMDRRLGPGGCDGPCEDLATAPLGSLGLDPFPFSESDPRFPTGAAVPLPVGAESETLAHWPFGPTDLLNWPPPASVLPPPLACDDGNPCTDDGCDPATGCVFTANDTNLCDDGDPCSVVDVCSGGVCVGTGGSCACVVPSLVSLPALPAPGQVRELEVVLDTSATPLGSYTIDLSWNPLALQLDAVMGGTVLEFSSPPLCSIDNLAGFATCTAFQIASPMGPAGALHVATVRMSVIDDASGFEQITMTPTQVFDTSSTPIDLCSASDTATLATMCGDVTGDSQINVVDAMMIAQMVVGLRGCSSIPRYELCDVSPPGTSDGECTIGDALRIVQCGVGLIPCDFTCPPISCVPPAPAP